MGIDLQVFAQTTTAVPTLSGRARTALQQHQRRVAVREKDLHNADRILAGALCACDGASQREMLGSYLEAVQELRVSLQRLEGFLLHRLTDPASIDLESAAREPWAGATEGP